MPHARLPRGTGRRLKTDCPNLLQRWTCLSSLPLPPDPYLRSIASGCLTGKPTLANEIGKAFVSTQSLANARKRNSQSKLRCRLGPLSRSVITLSTAITKLLESLSYFPQLTFALVCKVLECNAGEF